MTDTNTLPIQTFQQRTVKGTERHVYFDGRYLVKEYKQVSRRGDPRKPWLREHKALKRLLARGVAAPRSLGYVRLPGRVIRSYREFVKGHHIDAIDSQYLAPFAQYLASVHHAGVITCDLSQGNILVAEDNSLLLIDYGRSRTFLFRSPLFFVYAGKELARCRRRIPFQAPATWEGFYQLYRTNAHHPGWAWPIIQHSFDWWSAYWKHETPESGRPAGELPRPLHVMSLCYAGLYAMETFSGY